MFGKTRKSKFPIVLILFLVFFSLLIGYFFYKNFAAKKVSYLSPLAAIRESPEEKIEKILSKANIPFTQIISSSSAYLVFLKNGEEVLLSLNDDTEKRIYSLQLILKQFTIEGKKFKRIDFRFEKPTVLF